MIKELRRIETTFDDADMCWVEYEEEGRLGYEYTEWTSPLRPGKNKIKIEELETEKEIKEVLQSDNEMLYVDEVDEDDSIYIDDLSARLNRDIEKFPHLKLHFEEMEGDDVDGRTIVIYGGIITEVLF